MQYCTVDAAPMEKRKRLNRTAVGKIGKQTKRIQVSLVCHTQTLKKRRTRSNYLDVFGIYMDQIQCERYCLVCIRAFLTEKKTLPYVHTFFGVMYSLRMTVAFIYKFFSFGLSLVR